MYVFMYVCGVVGTGGPVEPVERVEPVQPVGPVEVVRPAEPVRTAEPPALALRLGSLHFFFTRNYMCLDTCQKVWFYLLRGRARRKTVCGTRNMG